MASSDVIELGSSDDEAEPVPKKKKPTPNAMVHFPNEVPRLVINPVKPALPSLQKVLAGNSVTITNVKKNKVTPQIYKAKARGNPVQKSVIKTPSKISPTRHSNLAEINLSVNPLSITKNKPNISVYPAKVRLPPGIIVKKANANQKLLPIVFSNRKKKNININQPAKIITTVELDDEEVPLTSGTSPQWYLRPEEQIEKHESKDQNVKVKVPNMELENNKEPDTSNYIEITIEDSPIKPPQIRRGFEVGSQIPITIDDSPVKIVEEKQCVTDSEVKKNSLTEPQSKKKLDYPEDKTDLTMKEAQNFVEIDLEILPSHDETKQKIEENKGELMVPDKLIKDIEVQKVDTPRRVSTVLITKEVKNKETEKDEIRCKKAVQKSDSGEFHPVYQKFIDFCFELENSDDMRKIVEKKIKTYYKQCPKEYVESEDFTDMVSSKIFAMKTAPDKMYLYIKDIVDELNLQRKAAKALKASNNENMAPEDGNYLIEEDTEYDVKRRRQIRKLEKTIKKLHRAVQKLEEQEVEFEDEEDSVYLLTERYKERLIRVHAKFCQLTNTKMPSEPRIHIEARPDQPVGPAKRLEKWVNKKVPIGKPLPFPDFHDVLRCVRDANDEDRLGWNEADIMEEARDLFTRCGKKLQRRRQENEWRIAAARISHDVSSIDPAERSEDLKKKLEENRTLAAKKEIDLLNKYADKQNLLKLVGEEIGDKEAEESPVESEDDEGNDESNSLEDKKKRKERLKRLLHEKTRKVSTEKEMIINSEKDNVDENKVEKAVANMESEATALLEETESKEKDIQEAEVINNDTVENILKDSSLVSTNQKQEKKEDNSDIYDFDSDIDELHLLQKLYSENEINSSNQESDSDTPIAISDTLDSDSETGNIKKQQNDDIISIENSSYSESEMTKDECESVIASEVVQDKRIDELLLKDTEIQLYSEVREKLDIEDENILLASSGEENNVDTHLHTDKMNDVGNEVCEVNLENCDENSLDNNMLTYEVPLTEEINETNSMIVDCNYDENILANDMATKVSVEKDKVNLEAISVTCNTVVSTNKGASNITNGKPDKTATENGEKNICEIGNSVNDCIDEVESNITTNEEIISDQTANEIIISDNV